MSLSSAANAMLAETQEKGYHNVYACEIVPAAELIQAGYAEAHDDVTGPWIDLTEKGKSRLEN